VSEKNIRLLIAYDGTNYGGWQRQKNSPTIQGIIEDKLTVITSEESVVNGAGRTDAGVHALGMVANFKTSSSMTAESYRDLPQFQQEEVQVLVHGGPDDRQPSLPARRHW